MPTPIPRNLLGRIREIWEEITSWSSRYNCESAFEGSISLYPAKVRGCCSCPQGIHVTLKIAAKSLKIWRIHRNEVIMSSSKPPRRFSEVGQQTPRDGRPRDQLPKFSRPNIRTVLAPLSEEWRSSCTPATNISRTSQATMDIRLLHPSDIPHVQHANITNLPEK